ncbi:MAG: hypothetical protein GC155_15640 [Alphaproteobacteria bacterium]|nr:hypothetical protein [Alphaproteobacteria bacterium]
MIKLLTAALLTSGVALAAAAQTPQTGSDAPVDPALVAKIEQTAVLPTGALKLADYDRYYGRATMPFLTKDSAGDHDVIAGVWLKRGAFGPVQRGAREIAGDAGAYAIVGDGNLPLVFDGGCNVITLYFDLKTQTFLFRGVRPSASQPDASAVCNGTA